MSIESRARVGDFVRRVLQRRFPEPGWAPSTEWGRQGITARLTRGGLVLPHTIHRPSWWEPVTRRHGLRLADELASILSRMQALYAAADEEGHLRIELWQHRSGTLAAAPEAGTREVQAILAPGCRTGSVNGGVVLRFYRLGDGRGLDAASAAAAGWVLVLPRGLPNPATGP